MSRKTDSRRNQIIELLAKDKKIEVTALSDLLHVSQVTIRKDLNELEDRGIITREHGYAQLRSTEDIGGRIAYHYDAKKKIAQKAAELINDGDTLMVESGSCCALLAQELAQSKRGLTLITNSAFIADYIRHRADFDIVLLGGIYQKSSQVMVGPMVRQCAADYYVRFLFIGTDGYSPKTGFTNSDQLRAQAVRDMAAQAQEVIVLTESEKFEKNGIIPMNIPGQPCAVVTDRMIPQEYIDALTEENCRIIFADQKN